MYKNKILKLILKTLLIAKIREMLITLFLISIMVLKKFYLLSSLKKQDFFLMIGKEFSLMVKRFQMISLFMTVILRVKKNMVLYLKWNVKRFIRILLKQETF